MREEIITVISAVTGLSIEQLSNDSACERPWNSLTHVELVIALEDKFQISNLSPVSTASEYSPPVSQ